MISFFKKLDAKIDALVERIAPPTTQVDLMRRILSSINLSDLPTPDMTPEDRKAYVARIGGSFKDIIEPELKYLIAAQTDYIAREASSLDQMWFARGTVNGLCLLLDKFEAYYNEHLANSAPPEKPEDPHNPIPEL